MKTEFKVTPKVIVKPVKVGLNFYNEKHPVIAVMVDDSETMEYNTLAEVKFKDLIKNFLETEDEVNRLDALAVEFDNYAKEFRELAVSLRKDGYE